MKYLLLTLLLALCCISTLPCQTAETIKNSQDTNKLVCVLPIETDPVPLNMDVLIRKTVYESGFLKLGIQGKVIVRVLVDKEGCYVKHMIIRSPHPLLSNSIAENISMLEFKPATLSGNRIKVWVTIPVNFIIK